MPPAQVMFVRTAPSTPPAASDVDKAEQYDGQIEVRGVVVQQYTRNHVYDTYVSRHSRGVVYCGAMQRAGGGLTSDQLTALLQAPGLT